MKQLQNYPSSGFSGGGGMSRKSFFLPLGRDKFNGEVCRILDAGFCGTEGGEGILEVRRCAFALKMRLRNESRINAKIAILIHGCIACSFVSLKPKA
jgi:hypothetical protein